MIISGGENIYPTEVESALSDHPAVEEVAAIGVRTTNGRVRQGLRRAGEGDAPEL